MYVHVHVTYVYIQMGIVNRNINNSYTSSPGIYGIYKPEGPEL